jgi:hypothetical protein
MKLFSQVQLYTYMRLSFKEVGNKILSIYAQVLSEKELATSAS